jgi:hypothetical protein
MFSQGHLIQCIWLNPWSRVFLEKLTVSQLVKKFSRLLQSHKVHYCVQKSSSVDYILSYINPVHILTPSFQKVHFNIILPSTSKSPKWSLLSRFSGQNFACISHLSVPATCSACIILLDLNHPNNSWWKVKITKRSVYTHTHTSVHLWG